MSYLNPHTHNLDGPDADGSLRRDATSTSTAALLSEVAAEMARQDVRWGEQNHPDGTGPDVGAWGRYGSWGEQAAEARRICQERAARGEVTWLDILREEVFEAFAEEDPALLRAELVQVEAVCAQWRKAIDRRTAAPDA